MIIQDKMGARVVQLFIPFDYNGKKIESIAFAPLRLGHVLLWGQGHWKTMLGLMAELAGVDEALIREVRFPDADRMMEAFMSQLTDQIRSDINEGRIPLKPDEETPETPFIPEEPPSPEAMQGPGAPLPPEPETGFDMSEEP